MSAAVAAPGDCAVASQVCPHCQKSFPRLCDLNKHAKSHSRPFKCSFRNCKYHDHGWPTAKELERHVNDKHSASPRTFPCRFASCNYESKRESNCKQHMEKKHGWKYVRSKSNGKRTTAQGPPAGVDSLSRLQTNLTSVVETGAHPGTAASRPSSIPQFNTDFVLFPDETEHATAARRRDEDRDHDYGTSDDESRVFIPWTSPATRILKNQSMLDMFSETYETASRVVPSDSMIDPSLRQHAQVPGYESLAHGLPAVERLVKPEPQGMGPDRLSWNGGSETASAPDDSPSDTRNPSTAYSSQFHTPHGGNLDFSGSPVKPGQTVWGPPKLRRRGSDEDDHRPEKKPRPATAADFTDTNMPDIFRFAHPQIYDRDQMEKYSPCHSSHRDISTLVRHLGRPAHRLTVSKDAISSFEIEDQNYPHPRVGICRRCWRRWYNRLDFEEHTANPCEKVSKGKREKWDILYESLTPLLTMGATQSVPEHPITTPDEQLEDSTRSPSRQSGFFAAGIENTAWEDHVSTPASVLSQGGLYPQPAALSAPMTTNASMVSADDYVRLQKENDALKQLLVATVQDVQISGGPSHNPRSGQPTGGPGTSLQLGPLSMGRSGVPFPRPRAAAPGSSGNGKSPERDSLVLHMGSHPHQEVDVQGLMNEPQENLSRQNSGLSSASRATVHHVSNSPPQRLAEYQGGDGSTGAQAKEATPNRKPPTSIPDSGYASASNRHRHGSFGDITHMPGHQRGHHRNSSSLSTLPPQHHSATSLWSPNPFVVGVGQTVPMHPGQEQEQQANTFTQMLEQSGQQSQSQQPSEPSFDDQFFNHQAYYGM